MAPRSACIAGSATLRTVLSRKAMPEPSAAAAITHGLEDGLHGAAALVEAMTPASHGWTRAATTVLPARPRRRESSSVVPHGRCRVPWRLPPVVLRGHEDVRVEVGAVAVQHP